MYLEKRPGRGKPSPRRPERRSVARSCSLSLSCVWPHPASSRRCCCPTSRTPTTSVSRCATCSPNPRPWSAGPTGAQQSYWYCTQAGLAEAAASGELTPTAGRTTGKRVAASKTGLREHGLALVDTVIAFHQAHAADHADWQVEVAHPTPAGNLVPDGVVLLNNGSSAFVEIDRTMSYARLVAKLERYDAYRNAPASGRGNAARAPRSHWQETYAGPSLDRPFPPVLFVFAPAPRRAAPSTREAAFHVRARRVQGVNYRFTVATTTLAQLTRQGPDRPVWRVVGEGEDRCSLAALPKAR
jgi:hypothetical protein